MILEVASLIVCTMKYCISGIFKKRRMLHWKCWTQSVTLGFKMQKIDSQIWKIFLKIIITAPFEIQFTRYWTPAYCFQHYSLMCVLWTQLLLLVFAMAWWVYSTFYYLDMPLTVNSWVVQKLTWLRYTPGLDTHLARIHTWLKYTPVLDTYLVWIPPWFWSTPGLDTHLAWIHTCLKYIPGSDTHLVLVNTWLEYTPGLDTHLDSGSCQHLAWMCTFCNVLWYSQPELI